MKKLYYLWLLLTCSTLSGQEDLMDLLNQNISEDPVTQATFKGTRIINGHSVETRHEGILEFLVSHRFGKISDGADEFFGLDQSNIRLGLEYGLTDRLMIGLGRSSFEKTYDGFAKYRLFRQQTGDNKFPVSVTVFGSIARKTLKDYLPENKPDFNHRLFYTSQILIARKFNDHFSLQLSPTYIHRNSVPINEDPHDIFALGAGGRLKLSKRMSINAEYFHTFNPLKSIRPQNALSIGVDIETGGHVFQLMLSNAVTMVEKAFITETTHNFFKGDIHFGFNISRAFHVKKNKIKDPEDW